MQMQKDLFHHRKHLFKIVASSSKIQCSPPKIQSQSENVFWRGDYDSHFKSQIKPSAEMKKDMSSDKGT